MRTSDYNNKIWAVTNLIENCVQNLFSAPRRRLRCNVKAINATARILSNRYIGARKNVF